MQAASFNWITRQSYIQRLFFNPFEQALLADGFFFSGQGALKRDFYRIHSPTNKRSFFLAKAAHLAKGGHHQGAFAQMALFPGIQSFSIAHSLKACQPLLLFLLQ